MFNRPKRNPNTTPVWVTEQYVKPEASVLLTQQVGNTNWKLAYPGDVLQGSAPPPEVLLQDFMYLQYLK